MKRFLILILASSLGAQIGGPHRKVFTPTGGISVVNSGHGYSANAATTPITASWNTTTGNAIVAICRQSSSGTFTVPTDTQGDTFTQIALQNQSGALRTAFYYSNNITHNAANIVSCNLSTTQNGLGIIAFEVTGVSTSAPLDSSSVVGGSNSGTSAPTSPSFSTANANSIIFFGVGFGGTPTPTPGLIGGVTASNCTSDTQANCTSGGAHGAGEYLVVSSTQSSITAALSLSVSNIAAYEAFALH